jgi:hypothetical protein
MKRKLNKSLTIARDVIPSPWLNLVGPERRED